MPNRLASEASLYLRQHANDPVDWYPWCDQALNRARAERRPILLSVGYSACHWCHVMARESFADPTLAALINQGFVAIKVDREERPDIDQVYQLAHQALQQRPGGWPLTAFLEPDTLIPFFVGTYFPPQPRLGMPGFAEVLQGLRRWFDERPEELAAHRDALAGLLADYGGAHAHAGALDLQPLREAEQRWLQSADGDHGGHRGAPKFPHVGEIALCAQAGDDKLRRHAERSLQGMLRGGLQDHLGGGFFRYCVDERWEIPHFEKMLYDNALLLPELARGGAGGDPGMAAAAVGIVRWLQEEMALPGGGFGASMDADAAHHEGSYYLWQRDDLAAVLEPTQAMLAQRHWGLDRPANFEDEAWHLQVKVDVQGLAGEFGMAPEVVQEQLRQARRRLRLLRAARPAPARDDKCLLGWNALLLSGLARAGVAMQRGDWLQLAEQLADHLLAVFQRDRRWYAVAYAGVARQPAFLDDHAALLLGLLDLIEARWRSSDLEAARDLAECLLSDFEDVEAGGFWFSAHDQPRLPQRAKPLFDDATPSGNGLAAQGLLRLGWLLAEPRYLAAAERTLRFAWSALQEAPQACPGLLRALAWWLQPPPLLIARLADQHECRRWADALRVARGRGARVLSLPAAEASLPAALEDKRWLSGGRVYWCEGLRCLPRFDSPVSLLATAAREMAG